MGHVSYTDLRANLATYMEEVCDSRTPLLVTRQNARSVVMIAEDEYNSMVETFHLLRSPANAAWLSDSFKEADSEALLERDIVEIENGSSAT